MKIIRIVFFLYLFHIYSSKIFSDTKSTDNPLWQSFSKLNEFKIQFDSLNSFRNNLSTISAILDQKNEIKFSLQSNPKISKKDILCSLIKFNDRIKDIGFLKKAPFTHFR